MKLCSPKHFSSSEFSCCCSDWKELRLWEEWTHYVPLLTCNSSQMSHCLFAFYSERHVRGLVFVLFLWFAVGGFTHVSVLFRPQLTLFVGREHLRGDSQVTNRTGCVSNCRRSFLFSIISVLLLSLPLFYLLIISTCFPALKPWEPWDVAAFSRCLTYWVQRNSSDCGFIRREAGRGRVYEKWSACNYVSG